MTDKPTDWAEKVVSSLALHPFYDKFGECEEALEEIATALRQVASDKESEFIQRERKAKALGVREAAEIADNMTLEVKFYTIADLSSIFRTYADKIEKGQA